MGEEEVVDEIEREKEVDALNSIQRDRGFIPFAKVCCESLWVERG